MFGPGILEQPAADEVRAIWSMEDQLVWPETYGVLQLRGGGYYHEVWRRVGDDWFLEDLYLERTYNKYSLGFRVLMVLGSIAKMVGLNPM
jgi:hypothetical protein